MLLVGSLVAFVDRQVVAIVVGPMSRDLGIGDAQIGWLYGIFALFYAVAGVPIASDVPSSEARVRVALRWKSPAAIALVGDRKALFPLALRPDSVVLHWPVVFASWSFPLETRVRLSA